MDYSQLSFIGTSSFSFDNDSGKCHDYKEMNNVEISKSRKRDKQLNLLINLPMKIFFVLFY